MSACVRVKECRLCDSPDLDLIISFTPTPPGDSYLRADQLAQEQPCYPLDLISCRACGAVQLADTVDPTLIYTNYQYTTSISRGLDAHFATYAEQVIKRVRPPAARMVLDIGSNDGTLLRAFKDRGYVVRGVDPAGNVAAAATAAGIETHCGYFTAELGQYLREAYGRIDLITANHVMANVANLHDFIEGVKELLAPDGTFVFETGYWPAIMRKRLIDTIEHEHIHYFSVAPLAKLFHRHDLSLIHVEEQPTKGGSLRGYVKHQPSAKDESIWKMASDEDAAVLRRQFACEIQALRSQMRVVIDRKPKKETWVGYGAAVGSTLLLYHFGLGDVLTELWDDNPGKIGRYSPGYHLPVVKPSRGTASKVVVLAWRYAEMIMNQHPEYRGQFLIPLPEVQVA